MAAKKKRAPHVENDSWVVIAAGKLSSGMEKTVWANKANLVAKSLPRNFTVTQMIMNQYVR